MDIGGQPLLHGRDAECLLHPLCGGVESCTGYGHWITDGSNRHECSECHKTRWVWGVVKMEYCEHCGAKMDEEVET